MKSRIFWLVVVLAALAGFYYATIRPALKPSPASLSRQLNRELRPIDIPPPPLPTPQVAMPALPLPPPETFRPPSVRPAPVDNRKPLVSEVPIHDGVTIDFSLGAPILKPQGEDKEALEKALKEMAEATKNTTFPPAKR